MKEFAILKYLLVFALIGVVGCHTEKSKLKPNHTKRTYPHALNLERVSSVQQLKDDVIPPDSVNLRAYVIDIRACPPGAYCFLPDAIIISDSLQPSSIESRLNLIVIHPLQFHEDQRYIFSLGIKSSSGVKYYQLLGYNK